MNLLHEQLRLGFATNWVIQKHSWKLNEVFNENKDNHDVMSELERLYQDILEYKNQ